MYEKLQFPANSGSDWVGVPHSGDIGDLSSAEPSYQENDRGDGIATSNGSGPAPHYHSKTQTPHYNGLTHRPSPIGGPDDDTSDPLSPSQETSPMEWGRDFAIAEQMPTTNCIITNDPPLSEFCDASLSTMTRNSEGRSETDIHVPINAHRRPGRGGSQLCPRCRGLRYGSKVSFNRFDPNLYRSHASLIQTIQVGA
jgi:hypothetical protein